MSMPLDELTAETACPSRTGRGAHYPRFRDGIPVTMPGTITSPMRREVVLLSLCGTAHLRTPPRDREPPRQVCSLCQRARAEAVDIAPTA
ncbi:hypothetical protein FHR84_000506 [Actinopolyspora biskrensis]|uniref:Uncharacterized protein n=1 Tax=Actinopolyspora biskrensis TaxID=1470178 RepID=A0A852YTY3_9ACTN|nr:hypothetical protein [Actinopolyspora biskrensis]NYH77192.1 hypothetical protein [Actinopolyspora biskrensis]